MVLAHRERLTPKATQADRGRRADAASTPTRGTPPRSAAGPGRLRPAQRRRHPGAAARRHRQRGLDLAGARGPRHRPLRARPRRATSTRCSASSATSGTAQSHETPRPTRRAPHEHRALPRPLGAPVHDRLRRRARPPQRDRGVHVRRADAQRLATSRSSPSPGSTATSTARSSPSS